MKLWEIYHELDRFAPFSEQESWDNSGLQIGDPEKEIHRAVVCLDCTRQAAAFALSQKADLVVTHHPILFRPVSSITPELPWFPLLERGVSVVSMHTSLDKAEGGVNDALCEALGLSPLPQAEGLSPFLRLCDLPSESPENFAGRIGEMLREENLDCIPRLASAGRPITKVALCGGAGGEFWQEAGKFGAELLITGEAKYHEQVDAVNGGVSMLLLGHWLSEQFVLPVLANKLREIDSSLQVSIWWEDTGVFAL